MNFRPFIESDMSRFEQISMYLALQVKYHKGVHGDNIICALDGGEVVGAGILTLHRDMIDKGVVKVDFSTYVGDKHHENSFLPDALTEALIARFQKLRAESSNKMILRAFCFANDNKKMQPLFQKGFGASRVIPWFKYDLTGEIYHISQSCSGVRIVPFEFTKTNMQRYLDAAAGADLPTNGVDDSWFRTGSPGFACFAALHEDEIAGAITIWDMSDEQGATEYIFVSPSHRRKGIAKRLIGTAFEELKARGRKEASLSVFGTNLPAIQLYLSLGYELAGHIIELTVPLDS